MNVWEFYKISFRWILIIGQNLISIAGMLVITKLLFRYYIIPIWEMVTVMVQRTVIKLMDIINNKKRKNENGKMP